MSRFDKEDDMEWGLFKTMMNRMFPGQKGHTVVSKALAQRALHTRDFEILRLRENIPVFIYEHLLLNGGELHSLLFSKKTKYLGRGYTATTRYRLKDSIGKTYSVAFTDNDMGTRTKAHIQGEIYSVPPEIILDLDAIHKNGKLYSREKRNIFLSDQEIPLKASRIGIPSLQCQMYLGIPEFWENSHMNIRAMTKNHKTNNWMYFLKPA